MRRKKSYKLLTDYYFFNIKTGAQGSMMVSRKTREEAMYAFQSYVKQRKDCDWLGRWNGKDFEDTELVIAQ